MTPRHLHPFALVGELFNDIRSFFWVIASSAVFLRFSLWAWLAILLAGLGFVLLSFWRKTYELTDDELIFRSGILERRVRHLPYHKIQNIQRNQWFFLAPFHLESIAVDSGGHNDKDNQITLSVVPSWLAEVLEAKRQDNSQNLQDLLTAAQTGEKAPESEEASAAATAAVTSNHRDDYRASVASLVAYALTSFDVFVQFLIFFGAFFSHVDMDSHWVKALTKRFSAQAVSIGFFLLLLAVLLFVVILLVFNVIRIIVLYFGFSVNQNAEHLTIQRGLFQKKTLHLAIKRVQAVQFRQNIFRQLLGYVSVKVRIITDANGDDQTSRMMPTLIPLVQTKQAYELVSNWLLVVPKDDRQPLTAGSLYQSLTMARNGLVLLWLYLGWILYFVHTGWAITVAVLLSLLVAGAGWHKGHNTGVVLLGHGGLVLQYGSMYEKVTTFAEWDKIQSLQLRQSWWLAQRNQRVHLRAEVRSDDSTTKIECRYIQRQQADEIFDWYQQMSHKQFRLKQQ